MSLIRLLRITSVLLRYRLHRLVPAQQLPAPLRLLLTLLPGGAADATDPRRGERIRRALEDLGPVFVKFGQMLSTRRDLLPADIADELQKLQDQVPPFCQEQAREIVEAALKQPVSKVFAEFEAAPLASASVAQVHGAILHSGEQVVVKIIRPGILPVIRKDLALMRLLAQLLEKSSADGRRLRPVEVVGDYEHTLIDELDLLREAANGSHLRHNFDQSPLLYVPRMYWTYCRRDVLVMERVHGIPIGEVEALRAAGTNMQKLAERGVEIFFTQVFRDSFFHADMHPGNIFVNVDDPQNPQYIALDFGIVGSLADEDQYYLARNLLAFFKRDYRQVAQLHIESGWVPDATRVTDFEGAIRAVCEPIFERPLAEISFGHLLIRLFQTARRFNMEVQPQLILLQKTLLNIEGLGRQLYPDLNLWTTAQPFLERWMADRMGPAGIIRTMQHHAPEWIQQFPELPQLTMDALNRVKQIDQLAWQQQRILNELSGRLAKERGSSWGLLLGGGLLVSAAAVAGGLTMGMLNNVSVLGWSLAIAGAWLLGRYFR